MSNVDIDASELDDVVQRFSLLQKNASTSENDLQSELVDDMISSIKRSIDATFDNTGSDGKEQVSLKNSWHTVPSPEGGTIITSKAPHARPLEEGVIPHYITPSDAGALSFEPENIEAYPPRTRNYDEDGIPDGTVTLNSVYWKPDEAPGGYGYVDNAQKSVHQTSKLKVRSEVRSMIRDSAYTR